VPWFDQRLEIKANDVVSNSDLFFIAHCTPGFDTGKNECVDIFCASNTKQMGGNVREKFYCLVVSSTVYSKQTLNYKILFDTGEFS